MEAQPVLVDVVSGDIRWRSALISSLQRMERVAVREGPEAGALAVIGAATVYANGSGPRPAAVVAPVREMTVALCSDLSNAGIAVLVLAAVPREREGEQYLKAGARAYLEMDIANRELKQHIAALAARHAE